MASIRSRIGAVSCRSMLAISLASCSKVALYIAMREAGVTKTELAKRLGVDEKEVRRMLDLRHGTRLPRIAEAVCLLGKRFVIGLEGTNNKQAPA